MDLIHMVLNPRGPWGEREYTCVGWGMGWVRISMEWSRLGFVKAPIDLTHSGRKNVSVQAGRQHDRMSVRQLNTALLRVCLTVWRQTKTWRWDSCRFLPKWPHYPQNASIIAGEEEPVGICLGDHFKYNRRLSLDFQKLSLLCRRVSMLTLAFGSRHRCASHSCQCGCRFLVLFFFFYFSLLCESLLMYWGLIMHTHINTCLFRSLLGDIT